MGIDVNVISTISLQNVQVVRESILDMLILDILFAYTLGYVNPPVVIATSQ